MDKQIFVFTAVVGCLIFCRGLGVTEDLKDLKKTINGQETSPQQWEISTSAENKVIFQDNGSISVTATEGSPGSGVAVEAVGPFEGDMTSSLFTITFDNKASHSTTLDGIDTHIRANSGQPEEPAVSINLAQNINLAIREGNGYSPSIAAYAKVITEGEDPAMSTSATIQAVNTNRVNTGNLAFLMAVSNSTSTSTSYSASTVIGAAATNGDHSFKAKNLDVTLGDYNILTSISDSTATTTSSASTGIGTASSYDDGAATTENLKVLFGDSNTLLATSTSTISSASTGIGTASSYNGGAATTENLKVLFGGSNTLLATSTTSSASTSSASTGIGAAAVLNNSMANAVTVDLNGNQTIGALAYSPTADFAKANAFGADNTDKAEGSFGWRVGIFAAGQDITLSEGTIANAMEKNSTVNILGAKLKSNWSINNETGVATTTLGNNQGIDNNSYASAFAIGNDFQIYIGGRINPDHTTPNSNQFIPTLANGYTNTVNIIGAINRAASSSGTTDSSLIIDSGWVVNTYGPVEDLARIDVTGGSQWNVYGPASNLPAIHVRAGVLHLTKDASHTNFDNAIGEIRRKMTYVDPVTGIPYEGGNGKVDINADSYPWNGSSGGRLTLNAGQILTLYVDSSAAERIQTPFSGNFRRVDGYISIDAGIEGVLIFSGGKIAFADNAESPTTSTTNYWLIRSEAKGNVAAVASMLGMDGSFNGDNFTQVNANLYRLTNDYAAPLFANELSSYAWLNNESNMYLFNDRENGISGLYLGNELEQSGESQGEVYANVELATLAVESNNLLTNAIADRLTNVKGCLADPFIHAFYGHTHQNELAKEGYSSNAGGFVIGADNVWNFFDERYIRLGAAFGYVYGKTKFFGSAIDAKESAKHNIYMVELFGAYEFFSDKLLKTNAGITLGYGRGKDALNKNTKIRSGNIFIGIEFLKNLYAYRGCQFGLWFRTNYNHITQEKYDEMITALMGIQRVPSVDHDFLTTTVGLNVEKEVFDLEHADKKWLLSLKAGWECQVMRKHSDVTITFENNFGEGKIIPAYGQPSKHAAVAIFGVSRRLNVHWNIVGSYMGRFSKDFLAHNLASGVEYSF